MAQLERYTNAGEDPNTRGGEVINCSEVKLRGNEDGQRLCRFSLYTHILKLLEKHSIRPDGQAKLCSILCCCHVSNTNCRWWSWKERTEMHSVGPPYASNGRGVKWSRNGVFSDGGRRKTAGCISPEGRETVIPSSSMKSKISIQKTRSSNKRFVLWTRAKPMPWEETRPVQKRRPDSLREESFVKYLSGPNGGWYRLRPVKNKKG